MTGKIAFHDLVVRAAQGGLTAQDLKSYFELDPSKTRAFDPHFRINDRAVDVTGFEGTAAAAGDALAVEAGRKAMAPRAAGAPTPDGTYVAEGDSWFSLPPIIYPPTMIDVLSATYPITNLAHWGDTLAEMIAAKQYVPYLKTGKVKVLLMSAGGDDLLGDTLEQSIKLFDVDHQQASDAQWYLTDTFYTVLNGVMANYTALVEQVRALSAATTLVVHGYDYARPQQNGVFLGIHFQRRGLQPMDHPALVQGIVKVMVDLFNTRLQTLAAHYSAVHYVDLRGTVDPSEWYDGELHPDATAAARLAQKLATALPPAPAAPAAAPLVA